MYIINLFPHRVCAASAAVKHEQMYFAILSQIPWKMLFKFVKYSGVK